MANLLTSGLAYNPYFYANAGLQVLYKRLGMAFYVKRDLAAGKGSGTGDTVQVRRAQSFTTQSMPIAEASFLDVNPGYDNLVIDKWEGNGFKLTDRERTLTPEVFIRDHLEPVAAAIADKIDAGLSDLAREVPWIVDDDATDPWKDFPKLRRTFLDNKAPTVNPRDYAYMVDGVLMERYESNLVFAQANTSGSQDLQRDGELGNKFGFRVFANQNAVTQPAGGITLTSPTVSGAHAINSSTLAIAGTTGSGTAKRGVVISIAGVTQKYALKADVTVGASGFTASIVPNLQTALSGGEVITFDQDAATSVGLAFQRNAFALVMQPLEEPGPGIISATVADPITGLMLRSRIWGSGGAAATFWALDALWGVKTLDPNLAVRLQI